MKQGDTREVPTHLVHVENNMRLPVAPPSPDMDEIGHRFEDNAFQYQFWIVPLSLSSVLGNAPSIIP